jgi:hypothetical protein
MTIFTRQRLSKCMGTYFTVLPANETQVSTFNVTASKTRLETSQNTWKDVSRITKTLPCSKSRRSLPVPHTHTTVFDIFSPYGVLGVTGLSRLWPILSSKSSSRCFMPKFRSPMKLPSPGTFWRSLSYQKRGLLRSLESVHSFYCKYMLIGIQDYPGHLHIGVDGWTSPNIFSFMGITVHRAVGSTIGKSIV